MSTPFTTAEFLDAFARYNRAVWPAPVAFTLLAGAIGWLAWRPRRGAGRWIGRTLAFLWAWMAIVCHAVFFTALTPAAWLFAVVFLVQAGLLVHAVAGRRRIRFRAASAPGRMAGAAMAGYALVLYPLLGAASGLAYPRAPTFGLPCPTTIFTLGVLLWVEGRPPVRLFVVPVAWSVAAGVAAWQHGIVPDYGLPVAAVAAVAVLMERRRRQGAGSAAPGAVRLGAR